MNNYFNQNNLLNGYNNYQKNNVPFQNNNLLRNNPMFQNSMNYNNSTQMKAMQEMQEKMANLRKLQQIKQNERLNELEKIIDKEKIRETIIKPLKVKEEKIDKNELNNMIVLKNKEFVPERENYWRARTNQPYKNILKNEDYSLFFQKKNNDLKKEELIVHKVTDADKLEERLLKEFVELSETIEKHDHELKAIYSLSEKMNHKKKFYYIHVNKYEKIKYDPADFNDMKHDKIELYKKEQEKIDKGKKKIDDIIEDLVYKGMLTQEDVDELNKQKADDFESSETFANNDNLDKLMEQLTEEEIKELESNDNISDDYISEKSEKSEILDKKPKAKLIKKDKNNEITEEITKPRAKLVKKEKTVNTEKINATISEDIKNKYKQRQNK